MFNQTKTVPIHFSLSLLDLFQHQQVLKLHSPGAPIMNISEHCSQGILAHMYLRSAENNVVSASNPSRLIYVPLTNAVLCPSLVSPVNFIKIHLLFKIVIKDN